MPWPDDVVGGSADRRRALAEEHGRRALAKTGLLGVATVVHRLGHQPTRRRHRRPQRQPPSRHAAGSGRGRRLDLLQALGEQQGGAGELGFDWKRLAPPLDIPPLAGPDKVDAQERSLALRSMGSALRCSTRPVAQRHGKHHIRQVTQHVPSKRGRVVGAAADAARLTAARRHGLGAVGGGRGDHRDRPCRRTPADLPTRSPTCWGSRSPRWC
jgi:hypothetical protein